MRRDGNQPDIDPANNDSLAGLIRFAFKKLMQGTDGMLPAQIIHYDRTTNLAQVQIMLSIVGTDGSVVPRPQIASIPVLQLGGGGAFLNFNLVGGDLGWICANDGDISLFLQTYTQTEPNTPRAKSFSDGIFIPAVLRNMVINGEDANNAVFSTLDGTIRVAVGAAGVKVTAGTMYVQVTKLGIVINGNVLVNGTITSNGITFGAMTMAASSPSTVHLSAVTGNASFSASGAITPSTPP